MNTRQILLKITEKWPAKVLSLAAALILSIFYRLNTLETRVITVPLKTDINTDFIPVDSVSHAIRVTLRGEASNILVITEDDIEAFIDLNKYDKEGTYRVPIQIRKINNAVGVEPLEISVSPNEINLTLEEKVSRFIHVFPAFSGKIAAGFQMTNQTITPESIIASGPKSKLDNINQFITETIDLENRSRNFTILVPVINDNPNITIHGNNMIEYRCTIEQIERMIQSLDTTPELSLENGDNEE